MLVRFVSLLVVFMVAAILGRGPTSLTLDVPTIAAVHAGTPDDGDAAGDLNEFGASCPDSDSDSDSDGDAGATLIEGVAGLRRVTRDLPLVCFVSPHGIRPADDHRPTSDRPPQT